MSDLCLKSVGGSLPAMRGLICLAGLTALILSGCSRQKALTGEAAPEKYQLALEMEKNVYRPGEAIVATVTLRNNSDETIRVRGLNAGSVEFMFGRMGDPEKMTRQPVVSRSEPLDMLIEVAPGETKSRQFVLTRLTHFNGTLVAQAHYEPSPGVARTGIPKLFSNPLRYDVTGERMFSRDGMGLIMKDDAIALAKAQAEGAVSAADAILIEDEKGFYQWWVNLTRPDGGQNNVVAWFVNPYLGRATHQAQPFNPRLAEDVRFKRPPNLPKANPDLPPNLPESAFD